MMAAAGATIVGGHSIDDAEPKYGFSVSGTATEPITNAGGRPGDQLVLYSDGIPEARGAAGDFGFDRLRQEVQNGGLPEHLHARIWRELEKHLGEESPRDDATLVILGRDPLPPPIPVVPPLPNTLPPPPLRP